MHLLKDGCIKRLRPLYGFGGSAVTVVCSSCLTCPSELIGHLIAQKDELVEEVDTLREMLRVR